MTLFIDLRATPSGGICAKEVTLWDDGTKPVTVAEFNERVNGRDVLFATHGFNVSRKSGVNSLSLWEPLMKLPPAMLFVGVLWPGDSKFLPVLDYPVEGEEAVESGRMLANFLNRQVSGAATVSFVSHSLGARMILETLKNLERRVRRLIVMAGAIEDNCLTNEYQIAAGNVEEIYTIASKMDRVLQFAFPIGNPVGEIIMHGHPYFKTALGRSGPAEQIPLEQRGGSWQIPNDWKYGHGDYLPDDPIKEHIDPPVVAPGPTSPIPVDPEFDGWESSWSAGVVSTQVR
ncbi:MAG TPA: DUF726 domain-containing protein [Steroidobacteraceae bacterium]|nr:DUF726 domain-containing protein [Steroidobacteraceae bacterium]